MLDDDDHKKLVERLNRSFENIDRASKAPPSGLYSDFVKMRDGQQKIAADRADGKAPKPPVLSVIKSEPPSED